MHASPDTFSVFLRAGLSGWLVVLGVWVLLVLGRDARA